MSVYFPEKGTWRVDVYAYWPLFEVFFEVENEKKNIPTIPGYGKQKAGFIPIIPLEGLTTVNEGYARIRFLVKQKRAQPLIDLYKIKEGTFDREKEEDSISINNIQNQSCFFSAYLPFAIEDCENEDDKLVEDWILVEFSENGRWEVCIYFENDTGSYIFI
ncbi:hypothetical protein M9Y10_036091 [Tritrichomonas musculus]|uniref:Uncharacterized protein n=1 Tax=Tritrichomonas musculus TaxID=1915356 RepID=A0ABR2GW29_9EUKA